VRGSIRGGGRAARGGFAALAAALSIALVAACGGDGGDGETAVVTETTNSREQVIVPSAGGDFNPAGIYERAAPGVVTVISIFGDSADILSGGAGQGSGFVVSESGEILTNAHVVTQGGLANGGGQPKPARQVFVELADRNRFPAEIVGFDPDADVALIKVDAGDIDLRTLDLSERDNFAVGEPVAAIGSPFGERQSLSVGVVSATDRTIESLTDFAIDDAIQTDASINPGNSGGPLLDADGKVIGINQQIETASGSNSGVGFAIPVDAIRYSLEQLREDGMVDYAYLGVTTQPLYPQLADELGLDTDTGALISEVVEGGPADGAGLQGSDDRTTFQGTPVETGGDVILAVDGQPVVGESDLAELISRQRPGETVTLEIIRDGDRQEVEVELERRPESPNAG
jgi:S1-C subfamily serine protease